ncbi:ribonuclease E/G [Fodinicurvata fenggangensis]|uniref:ribonuclease E/G n=1 Tax=Fodinicurvata fenggangensis TaxID=1121830 RepID=UPI00068B6A25|nr:ribonuclease E/G [Fodinicurvata fenggangensis]
MSGRLLISAWPGETRIARLDAYDELTFLRILRDERPPALDDIYLARVTRLDKGLNAAFVDLGREQPGFLPLGKAVTRPDEGTALTLRVTRAPAEDKGAKLAPAQVEVPAGVKPPACLQRGEDLTALVRGLAQADDEIICDDSATCNALKAAGVEGTHHRGPAPLFEPTLEAEIDALLQPQVTLSGGGDLLVEPVRTLTAIDVNSGRRDGRGGAARKALEVNLAAAEEIARQLRLRDLSGRIVVDFLEMAGKREREQLMEALRAAVAGDSEPVQVQPLKGSGLAELTRRRSRQPLHEVLCAPVGPGGCGWRKSATTRAFELVRALDARPPQVALKATVTQPVGQALEGPAAAALARLAERRGRQPDIAIRAADALDRYGYSLEEG